VTNGAAGKAIVGVIITLLIALLGATVKNAVDIATLKSDFRHLESDIHPVK
jgi:hypothetical protein